MAGDKPENDTSAAGDALRAAVSQIQTPADAKQAAEALKAAASGVTAEQVSKTTTADQPAASVAAAAATPGLAKVSETVLTAAQQVAASSGAEREALETALQQAINPEQQGASDPELQPARDMLREALLAEMRPYQVIDTRLFLAINHLPHTPATNAAMHAVTTVMNGGFGYVAGLLLATQFGDERYRRALLQILPPLWFATLVVEYPVKYYFRRRRPFSDIVQAITVGRKPGTYSFPSGHSAAAFAGAWLLSLTFPGKTPLWYLIAAIVGFSRIYLGAHYPSDVATGAVIGTAVAELTRRIIAASDD